MVLVVLMVAVNGVCCSHRLASPRHGFTIMNRLSMENLTEPITKDLDFQLQDPFLLYRNARCKCLPKNALCSAAPVLVGPLWPQALMSVRTVLASGLSVRSQSGCLISRLAVFTLLLHDRIDARPLGKSLAVCAVTKCPT